MHTLVVAHISCKVWHENLLVAVNMFEEREREKERKRERERERNRKKAECKRGQDIAWVSNVLAINKDKKLVLTA